MCICVSGSHVCCSRVNSNFCLIMWKKHQTTSVLLKKLNFNFNLPLSDVCNNCLCNNHGLYNINRLRSKKSTAYVITTACVIKK